MTPVTIAQLRATATVDLMTAARALGLGHTKAYDLARRQQFPCRVLRIGYNTVSPPRACSSSSPSLRRGRPKPCRQVRLRAVSVGDAYRLHARAPGGHVLACCRRRRQPPGGRSRSVAERGCGPGETGAEPFRKTRCSSAQARRRVTLRAEVDRI